MFLKKFRVVPSNITKETDHHLLIRNAIDNLKLENYESFCNYLTSEKNKELKAELTQVWG